VCATPPPHFGPIKIFLPFFRHCPSTGRSGAPGLFPLRLSSFPSLPHLFLSGIPACRFFRRPESDRSYRRTQTVSTIARFLRILCLTPSGFLSSRFSLHPRSTCGAYFARTSQPGPFFLSGSVSIFSNSFTLHHGVRCQKARLRHA